VLLFLVLRERQKQQEMYRAIITTEKAVKAITMAVELYEAYKKYQPIIKEYLVYIDNREKLYKDLCKWGKDKTLFKSLGYILRKIADKTKDKVRKTAYTLSNLCFKLNMIDQIVGQFLPILNMLEIDNKYTKSLKEFVDVNEFAAKSLRNLLNMDSNCGEQVVINVPKPTIEVKKPTNDVPIVDISADIDFDVNQLLMKTQLVEQSGLEQNTEQSVDDIIENFVFLF